MSDTEPPAEDPQPESEPQITAPVSRRRRGKRRRDFSVGDCFSSTVSVWIKNLVPFTLLTILIMAPYIGWVVYSITDPQFLSGPWSDALNQLLTTFLTYVVSAALVYGVFQQLRGKHATMGESISFGLKQMPRVLSASLLILLILAAILTPVVLTTLASPELGVVIGLVSAILTMIVFMGLAVVIPVCIFEEGGRGALSRSWSLTSGYKFSIFLFVLVLGLFQGVVGGVIGFTVAMIFVAQGQETVDSPAFLAVVTLVVLIPFTSMQGISSTVIYYGLRRAKEGIDTDELASVFD